MAKKKPDVSHVRESMQLQGVAENPSSLTVAAQMAKRKLLRSTLFFIAYAAVPLCLLSVLTVIAEQNGDEAPAITVDSVSVNQSVGKATALLTVEEWLAAVPQPLPGGKLVSWDGFSVREAPAPLKESESPADYIEEIHRMTLQAGEAVYDTQVLVLVDPVGNVRIVGTPSLMPRVKASGGNWSGSTPWFGFQQNQPSSEVHTAISTWADAYGSGSPKLLKQIVGDKQAGRSYLPLSGVESLEAHLVISAVESPATVAEVETWVEPNWLIARVELTPKWIGQSLPEFMSSRQPISLDVLVQDTDTASPQVVSWGGAGSGPSLKPYSVGITGLTLPEPGNIPAVEPPPADDSADSDAATGAPDEVPSQSSKVGQH